MAADPGTTSALTVAFIGVAGTVLVALLGAVALLWSAKIQSRTAAEAHKRADEARADERAHDQGRRTEEREEAARLRAEERQAQQELIAAEGAEARARDTAARRDAERQAQAQAARRFLAAAEHVHQGLRRRALEYANLTGMLPESEWNELAQALADVTEAFDWDVAPTARKVVDDLRSIMIDTEGRQRLFAEIESGLMTFVDAARPARD